MSVLVDELLLLAQLDAGRPLAREPVDLTRLAIDATSDARVARPTTAGCWNCRGGGAGGGGRAPPAPGAGNLMSNAARHTPKGTTVTVALAEGGTPGAVELSVTDDGPGIPAELQPTCSSGSSAATRPAPARGEHRLGLAIVDAVTTAHGGSIEVTRRPGATRFAIAPVPAVRLRSGPPRGPGVTAEEALPRERAYELGRPGPRWPARPGRRRSASGRPPGRAPGGAGTGAVQRQRGSPRATSAPSVQRAGEQRRDQRPTTIPPSEAGRASP